MKKPKINSLINKSLIYLGETSKNLLDLTVNILIDPDTLIREMGFYVKYPSINSMISRQIRNLKNSSYFKYEKNKIYLTEKGRIEIIKNILKNKKDNQKWDGKWWAIIFDMPEATRRERNFLRTELKWVGFKELQHSVWIFPFNIEKEMLTLLKLWNKDFKGDIRFLKIDKITEDKDIKTFFSL